MKKIIFLILPIMFFCSCFFTKGTKFKTEPTAVQEKKDATNQTPQKSVVKNKKKKKDKLFLMGIGMLRLNWTKVEGNKIRFRYSDLGLPADFSTRERASFMVDGTFGDGKYMVDGHLNYDPENRITEPPLDFFLKIGNENTYLAAGDYRQGVFLDSIFSRYYHPFRGGILGFSSKKIGFELLGGMARGESGIEELPAVSGSGPYYLSEAPILRGSEMVYLVVKSATNPDIEIKRTPLVRNKDYFIDYDRGSIIFNYSLYSVDEMGNPVFILASYQYESLVGRFTRDVYGIRGFISPFDPIRLNLTYIADADGSLSFSDAFKNQRGILTLGINVDSKPLTFFGELSKSFEPNAENQTGLFGGGIIRLMKDLKFYLNSWSIESTFPSFANRQLQYGYSLYQIFPSYSNRNIFLSPFQFTRNLGAELYPFNLSRLSIDEREFHGFLELDKGPLKISSGYGERKEITSEAKRKTLYISTFRDGNSTKFWGKFGLNKESDKQKVSINNRIFDILLGARQKIKKTSKGEIFVQADYNRDQFDDLLNQTSDTLHHTFSLFSEYLTSGRNGYFAGYRKEQLINRENDEKTLDVDIFEIGVRNRIYKGFFVDTRYRHEESSQTEGKTQNQILSLGGGYESERFRAMGRYEIQLNKRDENEGRRTLYSFFLFGAPVQKMSLSLRYYKQKGREEAPLSLTERSEEQLNFRLLWRPLPLLSVYSQWRYDTNIELYPPLDRTKSNSLAAIQGLKLRFSNKLEFLTNYKLLKIWGPIDNKKQTLSSELGYLIMKHFRIAIGAEYIDFEDQYNLEGNYESTVGYFKLVALY